MKKERPTDYFFIDWYTFGIIAILFLTGLIFLFPHRITISIPDKNNQLYILEALLRNITLFIGITFSFIILSFNIFYRYFGRYAFLDFFKTRSAKISFTLLVCTICLLIYSSAYIKSIEKGNIFSDFIYVFSLLLSIISFFSLFPSIINLLRNSQNRENIKSIFKRLNENWLIDAFKARHIDNSMHQFYHKDPISILTEIGLSAIKEFDNKTILVITSSCPDFFKTNIETLSLKKIGIDNLTLYHQFTTLLSSLFQLSVKERNEVASLMILNGRIKIEEQVLNNIGEKGFENFIDTDNKYKHWDLNFDLTNFFKRSIQFNEDEVCKKIIDKYRDFVIKAIKVLFPPNFKYKRETHWEATRETDMVFDPLRIINDWSNDIILAKKNQLFQPLFTFYFCVEQEGLRQNISDEAKCYLLNIIFNYKYDLFNQYSDLPEIQHISYLNFPFHNSSNTFKETKCKAPHLGALKIMSLLFSKSKLNTVVINDQKAEMLHLIEMLKEQPDAKALLVQSIKKFSELASKIKESDNDYKKDTYIKLEKYLKIAYDSAVKKEIKDNDIIDSFEEAMHSFTLKSQFENELSDKGFIGESRLT